MISKENTINDTNHGHSDQHAVVLINCVVRENILHKIIDIEISVIACDT